MALLEGPPVIAEDLLEGVFVDPLSVMCHGRWLYHTLPLGSTCLPSLPCAPPWSLERGTQGQHKKEILIRSSWGGELASGQVSGIRWKSAFMVCSWSLGVFYKTSNTIKCPVGARPARLLGSWTVPQAFKLIPIARHALITRR